MRLYRAVSEAEFRQLMRTGRFAPAPNTYEAGRFFALSIGNARQWAQRLDAPRIVAVEVADAIVAAMMRWDQMDGIGPALFASWEALARATGIVEVTDE